MSNKVKLITTVPGNVSINLPDGQVLKVGRVISVDPVMLENPGVAKYIEIGRIIVVGEDVAVPTIDVTEDAPAAKTKGKVKKVVEVESVTIEPVEEPVVDPAEETTADLVVEPDPIETSKAGDAAPVIEPKTE